MWMLVLLPLVAHASHFSTQRPVEADRERAAIKTLVGQLNADSPVERKTAVDALGAMGPSILPEIVPLFRKDAHLKDMAKRVIRKALGDSPSLTLAQLICLLAIEADQKITLIKKNGVETQRAFLQALDGKSRERLDTMTVAIRESVAGRGDHTAEQLIAMSDEYDAIFREALKTMGTGAFVGLKWRPRENFSLGIIQIPFENEGELYVVRGEPSASRESNPTTIRLIEKYKGRQIDWELLPRSITVGKETIELKPLGLFWTELTQALGSSSFSVRVNGDAPIRSDERETQSFSAVSPGELALKYVSGRLGRNLPIEELREAKKICRDFDLGSFTIER